MTEEEKDELRTALAAWVDQFVIADAILGHAEELVDIGEWEAGDINMENCKKLWLEHLETLFH